jgi:hypothetical protein
MTSKIGSSWSASGSAPSASGQGKPPHATLSEKDRQVTCDEAHSGHKERGVPSEPNSEQKSTAGMLERSLQAQLGRQLRSIFADVAKEPVPERFIKLLEELEAREKRR